MGLDLREHWWSDGRWWSGLTAGAGIRGRDRDRDRRRSVAGALGEFTVLAMAGFLFVVTAQTANGTQLRNDRPDAAGLLREEQARYQARAAQATAIQREVDELTAQAALGDSAVAALQARSKHLLVAAGMEPLRGPGLTVTLDDAPRIVALPSDVRPDNLVVHQQDVQAVVNALWAGGAEAIQLMDQRVISTSAVRCVGNTLILQGRVYSPPYRVTAVGDVASMLKALDDSPQVSLYQEYVQALGLGWSVVRHRQVTVPAYAGTLDLQYATSPTRRASGPSGTGTPAVRRSDRTPTPTKAGTR